MRLEYIKYDDYDLNKAVQVLISRGVLRLVDLGRSHPANLDDMAKNEFAKDAFAKNPEYVMQERGCNVVLVLESPSIYGAEMKVIEDE